MWLSFDKLHSSLLLWCASNNLLLKAQASFDFFNITTSTISLLLADEERYVCVRLLIYGALRLFIFCPAVYGVPDFFCATDDGSCALGLIVALTDFGERLLDFDNERLGVLANGD